MKLSAIVWLVIFNITLSACGGGGGGDLPETNDTLPPAELSAAISGPSRAYENSQVVYTATINNGSNASIGWEVQSELDIDVEFANNAIVFDAPTLYEQTTVSIKITLIVSQTGQSDQIRTLDLLVENIRSFEAKAEAVSSLGLHITDTYFQLADIARTSINQGLNQDDSSDEYCFPSLGSSASFHLIDNDTDDQLSAGDELVVNFLECEIGHKHLF